MREQAKHDEIRKGIRPLPKLSDRSRSFPETASEYCDWGETQGGRNGHPWGHDHADKRRRHLKWWQEKLKLSILADLDGILPRVECALRGLIKKGRAGKTVSNYAEALAAFCDWCVDRGYLENDPLRRLGKFDTTPRDARRPLTPAEITKLLAASPPWRQLLYETALSSGLRANELRSLTVAHLSVERGGLYLEAAWTKDRRAGFQPLPADLVARLAAAAKGRKTSDPLLQVPAHPHRYVYADLKAAGVPKRLPGLGKVDFHALRVTFATLLMESGASAKECQALMRHSTMQMTLDRYVKARPERLQAAAETVWSEMRKPAGARQRNRQTERTA